MIRISAGAREDHPRPYMRQFRAITQILYQIAITAGVAIMLC